MAVVVRRKARLSFGRVVMISCISSLINVHQIAKHATPTHDGNFQHDDLYVSTFTPMADLVDIAEYI